ncbi:hypothetical protein ACSSS7_004548 [Eimeria intestinalis]
MSRGVSDGCDRAATFPPLRCGSASAVSFAGRRASRSQTPGGSRDFGYSAFSLSPLRGAHAAMEKRSTSGPHPHGFGAVVGRSDSAWDAFIEAPEVLHTAAVPIASPNGPHSKVEGCRSAKSLDTQGSLCAGWRDQSCLPLRILLNKFPTTNKIPLVGLSGAGPGGEVQLDAPFGFCLLTFRNREVEEKYRCSRLCRRTSSSLGISFLFLLVLSSLCPVYGKVLCILGAPHNISLSFTVGCGCLIGLWVVHAAIVAFRKKLKVSDKLTIHLTLFLITLTLLLALAWANAYLCLDAENQQHSQKAFGVGERAADGTAEDLFVPSGGASRRLSLLRSSAGPSSSSATNVSSAAAFDDPIAAAAASAVPRADGAARESAAASAHPAIEEPSAVSGSVAPSPSEVVALSSIEDRAHDLLHANMFVLLLIMTLSVVAVYSLTDFSPAFLAWSWPLYLLFPVLTVTTTVISNFLLNHNLAAEATPHAAATTHVQRTSFLVLLLLPLLVLLPLSLPGPLLQAQADVGDASAAVSTAAAAAAAEAAQGAEAAASATAAQAAAAVKQEKQPNQRQQQQQRPSGARKRMQPQASMGSLPSVHKGAPAVSTAVEELQKLALAALRLVKTVMCLWLLLFAAGSCGSSRGLELLYLGLGVKCEKRQRGEDLRIACICRLLATLARTEALYSSRVMHALLDTATAQRWLSGSQVPHAALLDDLPWSADASIAASACFQGRQQLSSSREIVYSSRLLEEGHWQSRRLASMDSSAVCSGSDWHRMPSEGVAREPLTSADSPSFLAPAFAAAAAVAAAEAVDGSSKVPRTKAPEGHVSPVPEALNSGGVDRDAAAAAPAGAAGAKGAGARPGVSSSSSQLLTSLARSFLGSGSSQARKPSISTDHHRGAGQGAGGSALVEELLEIQLHTLKHQRSVRRQKDFASDVMIASPMLHDDLRPLASPAAFAGVGVDWDLDILSLAQSHQGVLQQVGFFLLRPFVDLLGCGPAPVLQLLQQIEARYDPEVPYHTATHACQVAHAAMVLNAELGLDHCKIINEM